MSIVRHALSLAELRRFSGWPDSGPAAELDADATVFVTDELVVYGDAAPGRPLFDDVTPEWAHFCQVELGLETPEWPLLELHPGNRSFEWRPPRPPFRLLSEEQARSYDELGWMVIENAVSPALVQQLTIEVDHAEHETEKSLRAMKEGDAFIARADEITFTTHLVRRSQVMREFCCSRLFQDLSYDLLGPDVRLYWDHAVYKKPGNAEPFPWHQDNGYTYVEPQQYITCWVPLTDANEENGCLWMLPRVHRLGTLLHRLTPLGYECFDQMPANAIPVPVRAGALVVQSSTTPHVTGGNMTSETRKALVIQYAPDGAETIRADAHGRDERRLANMPDRQFPILVGGRAAAAA